MAALALGISSTRLSAFDLTLVAIYLIGITLFGLRFRGKSGAKSDRSLKNYFLANNTIPWWAIALSIVSAETSTLTIISIPGVAFAGDFGFLQVVIGYMLGRIVVAALFLPRYFAGEMLTAYQLIDQRFGPVLHKVTAALFLLTRAAAEGVRVFAVSIVVGIAIGTRDILSIAIISALTLLYTFEGGMAAVIWTDVVQMAIYVGGTLVALLTLGSHVNGGWAHIHAVASAAGKFHMLDFGMNLTKNYTFWAGVLGGTFLTMASHGTDQLMVQRMLAARNLRESRLAILSSGVVIFAQFAFFLLIGVGLYVFYGQHPATFASSDRIFPTFIVREMPIGIAGLLVAAILAAAMSNLSAALNSLSSTTVVDFYMHLRPQADDRERAIISKSSTVLWALVLFAIAVYSVGVGGKGHVVEIGLSIASVAYGCLLGVFLLGTLTRFATEVGAIIGMVCGFSLNLWLWQGVFPVHLGSITIPHVAFTWYVLIGALATFAIGSLASLIFRKQSQQSRTALANALPLLFLPLLFLLSFRGAAEEPAVRQGPAPMPTATADFTPVSTLLNDAIAAHKLPGAVVVVGHGGHIVFKQAYGLRKLAGEPGLDGNPSPAEAMTKDTIFDMASLTKCLSTATAVMQLYEQGKLQFDDPIQKYLPAFNATNDAQRAQVTIRMLLTHTSGEAPDVNQKDAWGLAAPDKAEGFHRALTTPLQSAPGVVFRYSDINFILLGDLVETLSGESLDVYAQEHIYKPLGMTETRYLPLAKACGPHQVIGSAIAWQRTPPGHMLFACPQGDWSTSLLPRIAPTAHDDEGKSDPATNPDFDRLLRGSVHDPSTRRMGGVAGHAGVFSTAADVSLFAQGLLDRLAGRPSNFPLKQSTLELMTTPEQPGHNAQQLTKANAAERAATAAGMKPSAPLLAPMYPAIKEQDLRGYGWDIDTAFSKPRGAVFPIGSFGHTGFTGTTLWMDPGSNTYVILLANAIHPRGNPPISNLRGEVASAAAQQLFLYGSCPISMICDAEVTSDKPELPVDSAVSNSMLRSNVTTPTLTGIDSLERQHFVALAEAAARHNHHLNLGLLTNQTGLDAHGRRTVDILANDLPKAVPSAKLTTLFSPEHGIFGKQDTTSVAAETDPATGLHVTSLYGAKDVDRRPSHEQLKDLDAVVIDLQDAGVRFYTYEAVTGYFLEAAAREKNEFHHDLEILVLDRPNLIGGEQVQGPISDAGLESYTDYMPLPVRNGLTLGELAQYINGEATSTLAHGDALFAEADPANRTRTTQAPSSKGLGAHLTVIPMQHWSRAEYFDNTGLPWINPSPNLRSVTAATLYPGMGLMETTNVSVGRGTTTPFELFGAGVPAKDSQTGAQKPAWFKASDVAAALNARNIPGVTFAATTAAISDDTNHYPFHGQTIEVVRVTLTDRKVLDAPEMGIEILSVLHRLYPEQFQVEKAMRLVVNRATMDALERGDDPRTIAASWQPSLHDFMDRRAAYLLYQ
jgi:SSS family transporter